MELQRIKDGVETGQIVSWKEIDTTLIDPNRRLHIMSGIAVPEFYVNDDDKIYRDLCTIDLGVTLPGFIQATCEVGLASIGNNESSFLFALDDAWVEADPSGKLKLQVRLAANGEKSSISRFGFQIVVLAGTHISGVSGHVRWSRDLFDASTHPSAEKLVHVTANTIQKIIHPNGFTQDILVPFGGTVPCGAITRDGNAFTTPYYFEHLPLDLPLWFTAAPSTAPGHFPSGSETRQTSGPNPVRLMAPANLAVSGVDFEVTSPGFVK